MAIYSSRKPQAHMLVILVASHALASHSIVANAQDEKETLVNSADTSQLFRRMVLTIDDIGAISDIAVLSDFGDKPTRLLVAGTKGACAIELRDNYIINNKIMFIPEPEASVPVRIYEHGDQNDLIFIRIGMHWAKYTSCFNEHGKLLWSFPDNDDEKQNQLIGIDFTLPVVRLRDGKEILTLFVGFANSNTIWIVGPGGNLLDEQTWEAGRGENIQVVDVIGDSDNEIVYVNGRELVIRTCDGTLIRKIHTRNDGYVNYWSIVEWPHRGRSRNFCIGYYNKKKRKQIYEIYSMATHNYMKDVTYAELMAMLPGIPVSVHDSMDQLFVRIDEETNQGSKIVGIESSQLRVRFINDENVIVHEDIIGDKGTFSVGGGAIAVVKCESKENEYILVGYGKSLWKYDLR